MKLKTLEGLELGIGEHEEIRAEAVKWVKYFLENNIPITELSFCKFHNITSEDLK